MLYQVTYRVDARSMVVTPVHLGEMIFTHVKTVSCELVGIICIAKAYMAFL